MPGEAGPGAFLDTLPGRPGHIPEWCLGHTSRRGPAGGYLTKGDSMCSNFYVGFGAEQNKGERK